MKILLYSTNYYPEMTGIAKYNTEMAEWLVKKGHEVDVITAMPSYPEWEIYNDYQGKAIVTENINGVNIFRTNLYVPSKKNASAYRRLIMQLTFTINTLRFWIPLYVGKKKYDIVFALCPPLIPLINAILYKWFKKVPIFLHVQDLEFDAAIRLGMIKSKFLLKILNKFEVYFINRADTVSSITNSMIDRIKEKRLKVTKFFLFPNWADTNFIKPLLKKNEFRNQIEKNSSKKIIMYSGNMGKKQGLEIILEVADKFQRITNQVEFVFVGDGVAKDDLQKIAIGKKIKNVTFFPIQPLETLPELLAAADVHLVIQKKEAADLVMPSKLTNILSAGRTVVATAEPGTALYEAVMISKAGLVIEPENSEVLFNSIYELIKKESLNSFEQNAREYAEKYLDKEKILYDFEAYLKSDKRC
ncbi:WcaI family glycosyltransferase [Niallia circulans]|uniref:WcaI family glycosyltransferase n=1 Tax=Niallia circulans TaxID=1397 RepID=UPI002E20AB7A|nr:WcaI family glycosyltransferase [Niallia circulans]MED5099944.1 WcaI family glycosyltransferase [Niallia circulans]